MKSVSISGSPRVNVGKKDAKALRAKDNVPCIIYGGKEQIAFYADNKQFKPLVYSPDVHTVKINIEGKGEYEAIMQEIQFHKVTDKILHIDFLQLFPDKYTVMDIPVVTKGTSAGVREGGKLITPVRSVKVKALPADLPDTITVNITDLKIGDKTRVSDLSIKGVQFLDTPNMVVVAVDVTRAVVAVTPDPKAVAAATPAAAAPAAAAAKAPAKSDKK
jgi:large subunit ribosomal protein L25